ncbi:MAG TPA: glycosyltransferase family 2 protein [Persephonella sp.]|uniref:Lipopolysaccharide core biosynthesis glycosyltransferase WaaE n=1 Tax=Persephonella marina (strain DSM 14350 / EX-H1) TaxID=123214 RepID=C0QPH1_PERMH|nr:MULTISPECIES: glycosyltransferase family 2 protein [Persephonella]ACO04479.1 lipopolysaccharide core biosynthesis glycosyltransferase WaaE [Persephonella marina EX-H1]HCB69819.1 glycosyltransferase family 2 protein [Persephonella sp.]
MERLPLTVALISYNEEDRIEGVLKAVKDIASEIIVLDSGSTDRTVEIAKEYGAKVYIENWKGYREQKNSLIKKCSQEWILFLDCDEIPSKELKRSIIQAVRNPKADGYFINRKTVYLGKILNYAFQPDWKLRLVKRSSNPRWEGGNVHEYLVIDGKTSKINGDLLHYSYRDIYDHFSKVLRYSKISAEDMYTKGKKFRLRNIIINPVSAFIKEFFIRKGFLDGIRGFIVALSTTFYTFLKYIFLWEKNIRER